jgi:non-ribosomal peptide synthetase component F
LTSSFAAAAEAPPFNGARFCLAENARLRADKTALIMAGADGDVRALTFGEVDRAVRGIGAGLRSLGLAPGARVMIRMGNEADYVLVYFGALAAGLVALPSSPQLTEPEAAFLMENSGASVVVVGAGHSVDPAGLAGRILLRSDDIAAMKAGPPLPITRTPGPRTPRPWSTPPARPAGPRASCTRIGPSAGAGRCMRTGSACRSMTSCSTPAR